VRVGPDKRFLGLPWGLFLAAVRRRDRLSTRIVDWSTVIVGGRRLGDSLEVTWRTNGTNSTNAGPRGNAQAARQTLARRRERGTYRIGARTTTP
jgi:hypothetical protein